MWNCEVYSNWPLIKRRPDALKRKGQRQVWHQKVCWAICLKCVGEDDEIVRMLPARNSENVNWRAVKFARVQAISTPLFRFRFQETDFFLASAVSYLMARAYDPLFLIKDAQLLKLMWNCTSFDEFSFIRFENSQAALICFEWYMNVRTIANSEILALAIASILKVYKILNSKFYLV